MQKCCILLQDVKLTKSSWIYPYLHYNVRKAVNPVVKGTTSKKSHDFVHLMSKNFILFSLLFESTQIFLPNYSLLQIFILVWPPHSSSQKVFVLCPYLLTSSPPTNQTNALKGRSHEIYDFNDCGRLTQNFNIF